MKSLDPVGQTAKAARFPARDIQDPGLRQSLLLRGGGVGTRSQEREAPAVGRDGRTAVVDFATRQAPRRPTLGGHPPEVATVRPAQYRPARVDNPGSVA